MRASSAAAAAALRAPDEEGGLDSRPLVDVGELVNGDDIGGDGLESQLACCFSVTGEKRKKMLHSQLIRRCSFIGERNEGTA